MCRSTKHAYVITNVIHILHQMKSFASLPLSDFKSLLMEDENKRCINKKPFSHGLPLIMASPYLLGVDYILYQVQNPYTSLCLLRMTFYTRFVSKLKLVDCSILIATRYCQFIIASHKACRLYYKIFFAKERTTKGLIDAINSASKLAVKDKKSNYKKMLSIVDPKLGPQFCAKVKLTSNILTHRTFMC